MGIRGMKLVNRTLMRGAIIIGLTALGTVVQAEPVTNISFTKFVINYNIKADASYTEDVTEVYRVNNTQGIREASQQSLGFSESREAMDVIEAYTTTKDGKRIDVTPDKIMVQQNPASANASLFSDYKFKIVVFPQVEVGSVLTLHLKKLELKPPLPGVLSLRETFVKFGGWDGGVEITVHAPASMNLQFENSGMQGGVIKSAKGKIREWHWSLPPTEGTLYEPGTIDVSDISPYLVGSNLKSYDDLAKAYLIGERLAAKVTPAVQKQADEITQGINDKRAQAEAIYRWVATNIRYVAIVMNVGGWVPHNADDILQARYGDCKDHSTLLESLFAAKGIKSSPVLVNASNSYLLPKVAIMEPFNHAISYLPDYQLFVDSTAPFATFGVLSDALRGKSALILDAGNGEPMFKTIPLMNDVADQTKVTKEISIAADGSVTGKTTINSSGVYDFVNRAVLSTIPKDRLPQVASMLLSHSGQSGTGDLQFGDPRDLAKVFTYDVQFQVPHYVQLPGPGAFSNNMGIDGFMPIAGFANSTALPARKFPFQCGGGLNEEITHITLPQGLKVSSLPKAANITSKFGSYESSYMQDGQQITIKRTLDLKYPQATCSPADYLEIKNMTGAIAQDIRAQILYQ